MNQANCLTQRRKDTKAQRSSYQIIFLASFRLGVFALSLVLFACVPAETPEVLRQTPGAAVVVDGDRYTNAAFSALIPAGWRAINAPAEAAPAVTFAAPDGCALIHLATLPADPPTAPNCDQPTQTLSRAIPVNDQIVYVAGSAPTSTWDTFTAQLEAVVASLR